MRFEFVREQRSRRSRLCGALVCIVAKCGVWVGVLPAAAVLSTHHRRHLGFRQFGGKLCRCGSCSSGTCCQVVLVPPEGLGSPGVPGEGGDQVLEEF